MKKVLMALAATTVVGGAAAQSSVTLFGVADIAFQHVTNGGVATLNRFHSGAHTGSRIGFRGQEDLGGGLSAGFWLEAAIGIDSGAGGATNTNNQPSGSGASTAPPGLTFNRRSTVSLTDARWGEVRLGRDYAPQYWNIFWYDPWNNGGVAASQVANSLPNLTIAGVRASNGISYLTPSTLGGFFGQVTYFLGENPSTPAAAENHGNGWGVRAGWKGGPVEVAASIGRVNYATGDQRSLNFGGYWDLRVARLMAMVQRDEIRADMSRGFIVGGVIPAGPGAVKVSYSEYRTGAAGVDPKTRKLGLGYVYDLSRRTVLFTTASTVRNSNGAAASAAGGTSGGAGFPRPNNRSSGFELGIRHAF
ncbi:porin [Ramlibacter sp.]|uniref:porin n=1 Tax=Ramlibacter sp. TaxID=1917967 RepID=UPI003D10925C